MVQPASEIQLAEIWRYPVKSMGGETMQSVEVTEFGLAYDRGWSLVDLETNKNLTARRTPELLMASAAVIADEVAITLPDGTVTNEDSVLSSWLGRDVALTRASETGEGGTYENPMDFENDADWMEWEGPAGAFHDSARGRVSLVSEASLGEWELARFRVNLVMSGLEFRAEDSWVGTAIELGDVRLDITKRIARCVMVTRPQPGIERDLSVLKIINADFEQCLSIGATVAIGGRIEVGYSVSL